jgi:hypothetical protein
MTTQPKREPLKVGDKVRLKGYGRHGSGDAECMEGETARLVRFDTPVWFIRRIWKGALDEIEYSVFPSQIVRLRPRQRRRVWVPANSLANGFMEFDTTCITRAPEVGTPGAWVEFVEVRKR